MTPRVLEMSWATIGAAARPGVARSVSSSCGGPREQSDAMRRSLARSASAPRERL